MGPGYFLEGVAAAGGMKAEARRWKNHGFVVVASEGLDVFTYDDAEAKRGVDHQRRREDGGQSEEEAHDADKDLDHLKNQPVRPSSFQTSSQTQVQVLVLMVLVLTPRPCCSPRRNMAALLLVLEAGGGVLAVGGGA